MDAFEIFPKVDTASFNRRRWIREGTFSIVTDVELLKLDAFFLARLEQEASVLFSGLRCGVEAQLFCFENVFTNFLMLSDGKDEAFLVLTLFCFLSEELSSSQVKSHLKLFNSVQTERERESVLMETYLGSAVILF